MAVLLLFWPACLPTQASVLHAPTTVATDGTIKLHAAVWKVKLDSLVITIKLPTWTAALFCGLLMHCPLHCLHNEFLRDVTDNPTVFLPQVYAVFARYLRAFDVAVQPHDCCRFTASAWKSGGMHPDAIMLLGSWMVHPKLKKLT